MLALPASLQRLIRELSRLPSIGERSATRLAYHLLNSDPDQALELSSSITSALENVQECAQCYFFCERGPDNNAIAGSSVGAGSLCSVCGDLGRDGGVLCVVEKPADVVAIERVGEFSGKYHVLHGLWSPLRGITPEKLRFRELMSRIESAQPRVSEVILALSSTVEGDATAMYIARALSSLGVNSSRLAQGLPKGGELEYADEFTLSRAFSGRNTL